MSVCTSVKTMVQRHEWVADLFSILAVGLLFGTILASIQFYDTILEWIRHTPLFAMPSLVAIVVADVALIYTLLCAGSRRCDDGKCFRTFRGRRHGSVGSGAFGNWLKHLERVGKVHR